MPFVRNLHNKIVEIPDNMLRDCLLRGFKLVNVTKEQAADIYLCQVLNVDEIVKRPRSCDEQ